MFIPVSHKTAVRKNEDVQPLALRIYFSSEKGGMAANGSVLLAGGAIAPCQPITEAKLMINC